LKREPLLSRDADFKSAYKPKEQTDDWPKDYAVPNFGRDKETFGTLDHIQQAEKKLNTTFDVGNYTSHVKCDGPCNILAKAKDMDYKVLNLGVDKDIIKTHESLDEAEKETGHKWNYNQLLLE
jgi:hypothetical protein